MNRFSNVQVLIPNKDKSWGGYDAVKGHGVEETGGGIREGGGGGEIGRESEDELILFKMQLADQYKDGDPLYSAKVS